MASRTRKSPAKPGAKAAAPARAKGVAKASAPAKRQGGRRRAEAPGAATPADIAARAYALFEAEGGGDPVAHWLRAERELAAA